MRRREFIRLGSAAALIGPVRAHAIQAGRTYRLGVVVQPPRELFPALFDELVRGGLVEGRNVVIDPRGFDIPVEELNARAALIAGTRPDVIYCGGNLAGLAAKRATLEIPIVVLADDLLSSKLVASLSRPGGNITGISIFSPELDQKRLELLLELAPGLRHVAILADPGTTGPDQIEALHRAARTRDVEVTVHRAAVAEQIAVAIAQAKASGAGAISILASALLNVRRAEVIDLTAKAGLPAMYQWPEHVKEGGLIGYGPQLSSLHRQAVRMVIKILDGAKPAEMPVEQPTRFELMVNIKTAKALGVTIPPALLARVDEVIE
jgi:putative ABC transport system substrate-binding protein